MYKMQYNEDEEKGGGAKMKELTPPASDLK